jgi:hypothetical protein
MLSAVSSIQRIYGKDGRPWDAILNTGDPKNLNTAGTCKREQMFVLVALILLPKSVRYS